MNTDFALGNGLNFIAAMINSNDIGDALIVEILKEPLGGILLDVNRFVGNITDLSPVQQEDAFDAVEHGLAFTKVMLHYTAPADAGYYEEITEYLEDVYDDLEEIYGDRKGEAE